MKIQDEIRAGKFRCDYFLTTDDKILKKNSLIEEINIVDPFVFVAETINEADLRLGFLAAGPVRSVLKRNVVI